MVTFAQRHAAGSWMKRSTSSWLATSKNPSGDDDGEGDNDSGEGQNSSTNTSTNSKDGDDRKFTQDEVNRIVTDRLKDEKKRIAKELKDEITAELKEEMEEEAAKEAGDLQKLLDKATNKITKLEETIATLENDKREADLEKIRLEVVADVGLPETAAGYLKGETKEELAASAKELAVTFGVVEAPDTDLGQGGPRETKRRDRFSKGDEEAYKSVDYWTQR